MHKKCGVLLLFVAFLANFGVTLALDQASRGVSRLRSLTADTETNDDEERAGNPVLRVRLWLQSLTDPRDVFKALCLGEASMARLNDNPKFIQWLDYVELYRSKWGKRWFTDLEVFNFLRQTTPGAELAAVLQSIRLVPGMKKSAEKMQKFLIRASPPAIHSWLDAVWLGAGETPQSVFNILRLGKTPLADRHQFLQWLRFTEKYKAKMGASSYSDRQTLNFLLKGRLTPDVNLAGFFQTGRRRWRK
ncbi:hypothetical protein PHYSODRAFT_313506 [Phytophthora sojae]|uniref:Uncharacterized protein n=1 Tax=Phytophthora sojae (strain P6497) TaxID=1094619 RepID=G4ZA47_PHYSP|nr:hypothetical protein PHYSODRAFT_313506 [Phytophthora sojae]EGZ21186.1 hypothetical protein PHYSODRAFT_313506 [Phytophthora sojae]|eukprot:XP_009523903.1 hypothetical protein PHYSODRAFT_313506 [Phytophthora sojae]